MKAFGIDISKHNGEFNLAQAISEGVEFAIIKGGGGDVGLYVDSMFVRNYNLAKSLNLPIGVYWYSRALSVSQAKQEAEYFYNNVLKNKSFELPVYIDIEDKTQLALGKRGLTDIIATWCKYLEEKNYFVGIYASTSTFNTYMIKEELSTYAWWAAQWSSEVELYCGMWQFGGETNFIRNNKVAGQVCDQNYMLVDYSTMIKQMKKNGFAENIMNDKNIQSNAQSVIDIALAEVDYLEKATNYNLDDKTANAGSGNWTKYARDLDALGNFYNGLKNGYAWCDVFVDWCFVKAFGVERAKQLLCQPNYSAGAGCTYSAQYYKNKGQLYYSNPQPGDQIFFGNSYESTHTGIVYAVDSNNVYTVEGNTSGANGVVPNGGGVCKKFYSLRYAGIYAYGRPKYDEVTSYAPPQNNPTVPSTQIAPNKILTVRDVQKWLNETYGANLDEDNEYGPLTKNSLVKAVQKTLGTSMTGIFNAADRNAFGLIKSGDIGLKVKFIQCALICKGYYVGRDGADGEYGNNTRATVWRYQHQTVIEVDGICGPETANKLFT